MLLKALLLRLEEGRIKSNSIYKQLGRGQFSKAAYAKHPALAQVVLDLLRKATNKDSTNGSPPKQDRLIEKIFPAMEVIERVGVPPALGDEVKSLLLQHLSSSVWAMRDKTAACLSLLLSEEEILRFSQPDRVFSSNQMHGLLLLTEHALREKRVGLHLPALASALLDAWDFYTTITASPTVHELYHEILGKLLQNEDSVFLVPKYLELCGVEREASLISEHLLGTDLTTGLYSQDFVSMALTIAAGSHLQRNDMTALDVVKQFLPTGTKPYTGSLLALGVGSQGSTSIFPLTQIPRVALQNLDLLSDAALVSLLDFLSFSGLYSLPDMDRREHWRAPINVLALCRAVLRRRSNALVINALIELWGAVSASLLDLPAPNANGAGEPAPESVDECAISCLTEWYALLRTAMSEQTVRPALDFTHNVSELTYSGR